MADRSVAENLHFDSSSMLPPDLIAKLNECASTNFVALRDASLFCQTVFSGIVIAGLLFEGPELVHEMLLITGNRFPYVETRFSRFNCVVSSKRCVEYAKLAAFFGWILIIVGLGGELRTSSRIVDFSASIEECSDAKVKKATLEAGDATESAKRAEDSAKVAGDQAKRAQDEADIVAKRAEDLSQYVGVVANSSNPRVIDSKRFAELMQGQPKATVEIWYDHGDGESEVFANQLSLVLGNTNIGIGWDVSVKPFAEVTDPSLPFIRQDAGANGLVYAAKTISFVRDSPLEVLRNAIELSLGGWGKGASMFVTDPALPDNNFVIAIGHHVVNVPLWIPAKPKKQTNKPKTKP